MVAQHIAITDGPPKKLHEMENDYGGHELCGCGLTPIVWWGLAVQAAFFRSLAEAEAGAASEHSEAVRGPLAPL